MGSSPAAWGFVCPVGGLICPIPFFPPRAGKENEFREEPSFARSHTANVRGVEGSGGIPGGSWRPFVCPLLIPGFGE